jgi:excisionase family DNA binding protein
MTTSESRSGFDAPFDEVLTLEEAAAFLRVSDDALRKLVGEHFVPGQQIGGDWRFSKRGLADWLRFGALYFRALRLLPEAWALGHVPLDDLAAIIEKHLLSRAASAEPSPGSKQAVRKAFGVLKGDPEAELRELYARRKEAAVEGEG